MIKTIRAYGFLMVLAAAGATGLTAQAEICINEIMQSNIDCILDEINEFPDSWVELYNPGNIALDLGDYSLGTSEKLKKAYKLQGVIPAGGHVLVYCDKEGKGMHASFRLESGKDGAVYLFKDDEVIDSLTEIKKQPAPNISLGRVSDGVDEWGYQLTPTPGASNEGGVSDVILGDPVFSVAGGIYDSAISLELSLPDDAPVSAEIRFTTDGSEPTPESPLYTTSIDISESAAVRAKLFAAGCLSPRSIAHSFIFHPRETNLAIVSFVGDSTHFYSDDLGILSGHIYKDGLENFVHDWRRPVNVEMFVGKGEKAVINQLGEIRTKGETTKFYNLKSMALYANKRFGEKRFSYELFPDQKPGMDEFKSIELRNGGNDYRKLYLRDALAQRVMGINVDIDWQAWRPAVVYLNGKYMGMLNIRERSNEDHIYSNYDGLEDIDMVENWGKELKEGDIDSFNAFKDMYSQEGHTYDEYAAVMDIQEYINHTIAELYFLNIDYPNNNVIMWRPQDENGRWRWTCKDFDLGIGYYGEYVSDLDPFDWLFNPEEYPGMNWAVTDESTMLFRRLLAIPGFRREFVNRAFVYMGDFLNSDYILPMFREMKETIYDEVLVSQKFNYEEPIDYDREYARAEKWLVEREASFPRILQSFFDLPHMYDMVVNEDKRDMDIFVNGIKLNSNRFAGKFSSVDNMVEISGTVYGADENLKGWRIEKTIENGDMTIEEVYVPVILIDTWKVSNLKVTPLVIDSKVDEISDSKAIDFNSPYEVYDVAGRNLGHIQVSDLSTGVYILKQDSATMKYYRR